MEETQKVLLVANDLTTDEINQIRTSLASQNEHPIQLSLVFVKPTFPSAYFSLGSMTALAQEWDNNARANLASLGAALSIPSERQWLASGSIKGQARHLAKQLKASVIATGQINEDVFKKPLFQRHPPQTAISSISRFFTGSMLMPLV